MNIFRKLVIALLLIFVIGTVILWAAKDSPRAWSTLIQFSSNVLLKKSYVQLKEVKVVKPHYNSGILKFDKISARIIFQDKKYFLQLDKPKINGLTGFFQKQGELHISLNQVKVNAEEVAASLKYAEIMLSHSRDDKDVRLVDFKTDSIDFNGYSCSHLHAKGEVRKERIQAQDVQAACYEGKIGARFIISYAKMLTYEADVNFEHLNLKPLEKFNPAMFSNLTGIISGELHVKGDLKNVSSLAADLNIDSNGKIGAELLKYLLPYIPQSTQRKDLEKLIQQRGMVNLEKGIVHLESVGDKKISSLINLESRKLNLNTNLTVDINVEGGIKNFYQHILKTFKTSLPAGRQGD